MIQTLPDQVERKFPDEAQNAVSSIAPHAELLRTHRPDPHLVTRIVSARVTLPVARDSASSIQSPKIAFPPKTRL